MNLRLLNSSTIKAEASRLGFFACGMAKAEPVCDEEARKLRLWLDNHGHANMEYMAKNIEIRLNPQLLLDNAKTIISVALNYAPARHIPSGEPQLAAYALGKDYHDIMRSKLHKLASTIGLTPYSDDATNGNNRYRACVDTAPILERYWAEKAGLGWRGRNCQLIIPQAGSMFFLGEIITDADVDMYDTPAPSRCAGCHACIDACPTGALASDCFFDSSLCLSYQTIENREDNLPANIGEAMGETLYGCDRCQQACPWNRFAKPNTTPELQPSDRLIGMTWDKWQNLTEEECRQLFKGSAVKRAKYKGLMRNIRALTKPKQQK